VILLDANLLLYAYHPRAEQHEKSRIWLEAALSGPELVRFAWLTDRMGLAPDRNQSARPLGSTPIANR